jgi:aspartyl-tRNA(Asn)/glutamyl-tRNA(Gln) amidotransferase subunit B
VTLTQVRPALGRYFEGVVAAGGDATLAKNWVLGGVSAKLNELGSDDVARLDASIPPARLAGLLALIARGTISGSIAKDVFEKMFATARAADDIVAADGLTQIDDEAQIGAVVADVLARHPEAAAQYRAGKTAAFGFLVGQAMKAGGGTINPRRVNELLRRALES